MTIATTPSLSTPTPLALFAGVEFARPGGRILRLDIVCSQGEPEAPRPAAIWIHGGGWWAGTHVGGLEEWCCPLLAAHGYVAVTIDYRLSGEAPFPAQIHDIKAAIRWLRANTEEYGVDPDHIGVWGSSSGGHLAALAGLTGDLPELEGDVGPAGYSSRVRAIAAACPGTDFLRLGGEMKPAVTDLVGGTLEGKEDVLRLASPLYHVHPASPPFLIAHGTIDETVPFEQGRRLHEALVAAGTESELVPLEGLYHNWTTRVDAPGYAGGIHAFGPMALRFFEKHLRPPDTTC